MVIFLLYNYTPVLKMFSVMYLFLLVAFFNLLVSGDCSSCLNILSYEREGSFVLFDEMEGRKLLGII